jgi:hypothetical protein
MHQAKLDVAFGHIPAVFFDQPKINIIDYGCGQGIGTMCYADFLSQKGITQNIKSVSLIEPSEICLKRAALHVSKFFPDAEISTINKTFDELSDDDINCEEDVPTLHIMSNVLDLLDFDLERFAELINDRMKGYNQFVCVGPYFGFQEKDKRMEDLYLLLNGDENFCKFYEKYELNANKAWTAQIRCFSNGELEEELSTEVTDEEIRNGVEDEFGVVYSREGKRLLKCTNKKIKFYTIKKETIIIGDSAYFACVNLEYVTIPNFVTTIGEFAFENCVKLQYIDLTENVATVKDGVFSGCTFLRSIIVRNPIVNIKPHSFGFTRILQISNPWDIQNSKKCFTLEMFNGLGFEPATLLQQIIIPEGSVMHFKQMLPKKLWDKLYYLKKAVVPQD